MKNENKRLTGISACLLYILLFIQIFSSCAPDYSADITGKWKCEKMEYEFSGPPDPDADIHLNIFRQGIEFKNDNTCKSIPEKNENEENYFYIGGGVWDGSYRLDGENLTVNEKMHFRIVSVTRDELKMDLSLTLKDYVYNYGHLQKLLKQGTGANLVIHYTFSRIQTE